MRLCLVTLLPKDFVSLLVVAVPKGSEQTEGLLSILCLLPEPQDVNSVGFVLYFSINSPAFFSRPEQLQMSFYVYVK
jgi:hypothetical protein